MEKEGHHKSMRRPNFNAIHEPIADALDDREHSVVGGVLQNGLHDDLTRVYKDVTVPLTFPIIAQKCVSDPCYSGY